MRRALASTDRGPVAVFGPVDAATRWPVLLTIAVREGLDPRGVTLAELDLIFLIGEEFLTAGRATSWSTWWTATAGCWRTRTRLGVARAAPSWA